ncbi:MAG: hypothetical protein ACLPYS_04220 [Vulcanimicrobiaceae bacterium]
MRAHGFDWDWWRRLADHGLSFGAGGLGLALLIAGGMQLSGPVVPPPPDAASRVAAGQVAALPRAARSVRSTSAGPARRSPAAALPPRHRRPRDTEGAAGADALAPPAAGHGTPPVGHPPLTAPIATASVRQVAAVSVRRAAMPGVAAVSTPLPHGWGVRVVQLPKRRLSKHFSCRTRLVSFSISDAEDPVSAQVLPVLRSRTRR